MPKIDIDLLERILKDNALDSLVIAEIMRNLQEATRENIDEDGEEKLPAVKKQYVVLLADENGHLADTEWVGWVLQVPEDEPMQDTALKVVKAGRAFNATKKGRRHPVATIGETCESVPTHIFADLKVWIKTKEPVLVIPVKNALGAHTFPSTSHKNDDACDDEDSYSRDDR
jgi:hypothetical protein